MITTTTASVLGRSADATTLYTSRLARHPLRRGHAHLLCIAPMLTDDPRRGSNTRWDATTMRPEKRADPLSCV